MEAIELALGDRIQTHGGSLHRGCPDGGFHFSVNINRAELGWRNLLTS
jgi:hypothetical protein